MLLRWYSLASAVLLLEQALSAQEIITTFAGTDQVVAVPISAKKVSLGAISSVSTDGSGNLYVADIERNLVLKVSSNGVLDIILGKGSKFDLRQDICTSAPGGPGWSYNVSSLASVAATSDGTVYAVSMDGIYRIMPDLRSTRIGGICGNPGFAGDGGPSASARFATAGGAMVDKSGAIYLADTRNHRIRKVSSDGTVTTVAGNGRSGFSGDGGLATSAILSWPRSVAIDSSGALYIADTNNHRIRRVSPTGTISTFAGNGDKGFAGDGGPAINASLNGPRGLAFDSMGALYISDTNNHRIRKVSPTGVISTVAGIGRPGFSGDGGAATNAALNAPHGIHLSSSGALLIADTLNRVVRQVDNAGNISTIVGKRGSGLEDVALSTSLSLPQGIAADRSGNVYVANTFRNQVLKFSPDGKSTAIAGYGLADFSGDGELAVNAALWAPQALAVDTSGNLYIADTGNDLIRKVTLDGKISTIAGGGGRGFNGDGGLATRASLSYPAGIAVNTSGEIYIADMLNQRIRKVSTDGSIKTVAGNGQSSFTGDNGPAVEAALYDPQAVAVDTTGNLYIADTWNSRIRKVTADGIISTIAGNGLPSSMLENGVPATETWINMPTGLTIDPRGFLYITEQQLNRIRQVGPNGVIRQFAGSGAGGYLGDGGPALTAQLRSPSAIASDGFGNIYIADQFNNRVRQVHQQNSVVVPNPQILTFVAESGSAAPAGQSVALQSTVLGRPYRLVAETSDGGDWLRLTPTAGYAPSRVKVQVDPSAMPPGSYTGAIRILDANGVAGPQVVQVNLTVQRAARPALLALPQQVSFSLRPSDRPSTQLLVISAKGDSPLPFNVDSQAAWLTVSGASSITSGNSPAVLTVSADPRNLGIGAYQGQITISGFGSVAPVTVAVMLEVRGSGPRLKVSQSGLYFEAVSGAINGALPKTLYVLNTGDGVVPWQAVDTSQAPNTWLTLSATTGSADASAKSPTGFDIQADASHLSAGLYQASIVITAADGSSDPQTVNVLFRVLPAGTARLPELGLWGAFLFTNSGIQTIATLNPNPDRALGYQFRALDGDSTLDYIPRDGILDPASLMPLQMRATAFLPAGFLERKLELLWGGKDLEEIRVLQVRTRTGCTASEYRSVFVNASDGFTARPGEPFPIEVMVADDCGQPLTSGAVMATFLNDDAPVPLVSLGDGRWTGTWVPATPAPYGARITVWTLAATGTYATESLEGAVQASL